MNDPKDKKTDELCEGLECAEKTVHESLAQNNPDWVNDDGECDSCVSLEHEMADPLSQLPKELEE